MILMRGYASRHRVKYVSLFGRRPDVPNHTIAGCWQVSYSVRFFLPSLVYHRFVFGITVTVPERNGTCKWSVSSRKLISHLQQHTWDPSPNTPHKCPTWRWLFFEGGRFRWRLSYVRMLWRQDSSGKLVNYGTFLFCWKWHPRLPGCTATASDEAISDEAVAFGQCVVSHCLEIWACPRALSLLLTDALHRFITQ